MPKKALHFTKVLQCKLLKSLAICWIKVREIWSYIGAYYVIFQFPHAYMCQFCRQITKDYKMFSMRLQNKDKTETQNALCNFSKSPYMCKLLIVWIGALCGLCIFALYIRLAVCACWCGSLGLFIWSWLVLAFRAWERERVWRFCVFVSVDVKYIIHYKCICEFICSL